MPRYHFEFTRPDGVVLLDETGAELSDLATARAHARTVIRDVQRNARADRDWSGWIATIRSPESGEAAVIRFKDVIALSVSYAPERAEP